jgi:hypothetical protein
MWQADCLRVCLYNQVVLTITAPRQLRLREDRLKGAEDEAGKTKLKRNFKGFVNDAFMDHLSLMKTNFKYS